MGIKLFDLNKVKSIGKWVQRPFAEILVLLLIAIVCYGLMINRLGYFWDDFPVTYIRNIFGSAGLEDYFSTNRPFWGYLFQITFNIFKEPWQWQSSSLLWRWLSAVILWLLLRKIWPNRKSIAIWASILFLVYPGFKQQHISVIYSNLFIVLNCYLLSLYINIKTLRIDSLTFDTWKLWALRIFALMLSLYNLLAMEYFFTLELLRPFIVWIAIEGIFLDRRKRFRRTMLNWLPYLAVWLGVAIWRVFFFSFQTENYELTFLQQLQISPVKAFTTLLSDIGRSLWVVIATAWTHIFKIPDLAQSGLRTTAVTFVIIIAVCVISAWFLIRKLDEGQNRRVYLSVFFLGIVAMLLGGVPWWLVQVAPSMGFPANRFTLPFMLGVSLFITGFLGILPLRGWMKAVILAIMVSFAVGNQFLVVNQFRRDWETQRRFFWQLAWRIPGLKPGTTVMVNKLPVTFYSDNSLTAPLNWFWAPQNDTKEMAYLLLFPTQRLGMSLTSLHPDTPIFVDYLAAEFNGNTSQVVSISYEPPACMRVLDKSLDNDNRMLPLEMQAAAALSSTKWILTNQTVSTDILPENLYAQEPVHGWCYYYEIADLARQQEKWEEVVNLGDQAYQLNDYPNDPFEHFLYIEGYANVGDWKRSIELSEQSLAVTSMLEPLLCRLWQRIDTSTGESPEKDNAITTIYSKLNCGS